MFHTPELLTKDALENGHFFAPKFDEHGLITAVTTDARTGQVLMLAYMNKDSLTKTLQTGQVWYYSRSRKELWQKGATSGQLQTLVDMRTDCDQDALLLRVNIEGDGGCCHTGRASCFYRMVGKDGLLSLNIKTDSNLGGM